MTIHSNEKVQDPSVVPQQNHFKQDNTMRNGGFYIPGYIYSRNFGTEMKKAASVDHRAAILILLLTFCMVSIRVL
jgi:hypothetical protein